MKSKNIKTHKVNNYSAVFEHDLESKWYTVSIPALSGCISQGKTFEDAMKNIKEAAELYLETISAKEKNEILKYPSSVIIAPIQLAF